MSGDAETTEVWLVQASCVGESVINTALFVFTDEYPCLYMFGSFWTTADGNLAVEEER